jgi:hypothetical protein
MPRLPSLPVFKAAFLILLMPAAAAAQQRHPQAFQFAQGRSSAEIHFELNSNKVYLPVRVNGGATLWFAADTGASETVMDMNAARQLGLQVAGSEWVLGAGESQARGGRVRVDSLGLPGVDYYPRRPLMAVRMGPVIDRFEGRQMNGLFGSDFFEQFVVEIDYQARVMRLWDRRAYSYRGTGTIVPITPRNGWIFARGSVQPRGARPIDALFMIDSGARVAMTLNTPFVREHRLLTAAGPTLLATVGGGVGGEVRHHVCRLESADLGGVSIKEPIATLSEDRRSVFASDDFQGLIGADILRRYRVIFDYGGKRMILERTAMTDARYEFDPSGLFLVADGPEFRTLRVYSVVEGGPAARAGLAKNDVIESIDGESGLPLEKARAVLRTVGAARTLVVRHGGEVRSVRLKLEPLL